MGVLPVIAVGFERPLAACRNPKLKTLNAKLKTLNGPLDILMATWHMHRRLQVFEHCDAKGEVVVRILSKVLVVVAIFVAGCASDRDSVTKRFISPGNGAPQGTENVDVVSYWDSGGAKGKPRIVIDLDQQRAYFYRGDQVVGVSVVSTGREGYDTPPGEFRITEKDQGHVSSLYGDYVDSSGQVVMQNVDINKDHRPPGTTFRGAPMPYFLRIHGGIGMHAGYLPGYPASHGCIRMPEKMAAEFFQSAAVGTPVEIRRAPEPDYAREPDYLPEPNYVPSPISQRYSDFSSFFNH
jgi:hypothetical protein